MLDAIGRTLFRLLVTRRRLLEWVTADRSAHVEASASDVSARWGRSSPRRSSRSRSRAGRAGRLPLAAPILVLWCLLAGDRLRQPGPLKRYAARRRAPSAPRFAATARKTWRFFEEFVGTGRSLAAARQLPGESPRPARPPHLADQHRACSCCRRSRPTISATSRSTGQLHRIAQRPSPRCCACNGIAVTSTTGTTRRRLPRCSPAYISTVDSGNLAGHLVTLRAAWPRRGRSRSSAAFLHALDDLADLVERARPFRDGDAARLKPFLKELGGSARSSPPLRPRSISGWCAGGPARRCSGCCCTRSRNRCSRPPEDVDRGGDHLARSRGGDRGGSHRIARPAARWMHLDVSRAVVALPAPVPQRGRV